MNVDRLIFWGVILLTLSRCLLAASLEITAEEALFWKASQQMAPFYLDHGPLVPAMMKMSTAMLGDTVFAVRFWNPLLILLATGLVFGLARSVYHQVAARWSVVVFQLCPLTNFAGVLLPDVAVALCLILLGLWLVWCGLHRASRWHWSWSAGGLAFGLATTLWLPLAWMLVALVVTMGCVPRWREIWRRPGPWVLLATAFLTVAVCLIASGHGALAVQQILRRAGMYPGAMMLGLMHGLFWATPLIVAGFVWLLRRRRKLMGQHGAAFLGIFGLVSVVIGGLWSFFFGSWTLLWWVGTVPCLIVLVGEWMAADLSLDWKARWRRWALLTTGLLAIIGVCTENLRMLGIPWPRVLNTPRLVQGWEETASSMTPIIESAAIEQPNGMLVIADSPESAALLEFYLPSEALIYRPGDDYPHVHVVESAGMESIYDLWPDYSHALPDGDGSPFLRHSAIYLTAAQDTDLPPKLIHAFKSSKVGALLEIKRRGRLLHQWKVYHVYEYGGLPR